MRLTGFFILSCFVNLFAVSNLMFTPDTIQMGEKTILTGDFSAPGDSADVLLFVDENANNVFDEGTDLLIYSSEKEGEPFIDGGDDMDTIADGKTVIEFETGRNGPFPFAGYYVIILTDNGGAASAGVLINPGATTNTTVSGKITGPSGAGLKNIMVYSEVKLNATRSKTDTKKIPFFTNVMEDEIRAMGRSDVNGDYTLYLPDSTVGKRLYVMAMDEYEVYADSAFIPANSVDTVVATSLTGINFQFKKATQFLAGVVVDEAGNFVADARLSIENRDDNIRLYEKVDSTGTFLVPISPGKWSIWFEGRDMQEQYMSPDVNVTVQSTDDTVKVVYMVYSTDATISGVVHDSAGIDLEDKFGVNVSVDTTGNWSWDQGVWYTSYGEVQSDGSFSIPVNSKFTKYRFDTWVEWDALPQGYFVTPDRIDSVGPGQSDIVITIGKGDKFINLTVVDENNTPIANADVEASQSWSDGEVVGQTDGNGNVLLAVSVGDWEIFLDDNSYMNSESKVTINSTDDTVAVTYQVQSTDATITGFVTGDIAGLQEIYITANTSDSSGNRFYAEAEVTQTGTFALNVSSLQSFSSYYVQVDTWDLPQGYLVMPYFYENVLPGADSLLFVIMKPTGSISGIVDMTVPQDAEAGVTAIDSSKGIVSFAKVNPDKTYKLDLPNGIYTVVGGYLGKTDTLVYTVNGVIINDNDVIINFSDTGAQMVPVIFTPVTEQIAFSLKNYPNPFRGYTNISFSSPLSGNASLKIFDMSGKTVLTLFSGNVDKGHYYIRLDADRLGKAIGSGYYVARLTIDGKKKFRKNIRLINMK